MYIEVYHEGYATQIARAYKTDLSPIQKQLERLEKGDILACRKVGRTRLYRLNPKYSLYQELQLLLKKAVSVQGRTV